jgi:hypothetical protein
MCAPRKKVNSKTNTFAAPDGAPLEAASILAF